MRLDGGVEPSGRAGKCFHRMESRRREARAALSRVSPSGPALWPPPPGSGVLRVALTPLPFPLRAIFWPPHIPGTHGEKVAPSPQRASKTKNQARLSCTPKVRLPKTPLGHVAKWEQPDHSAAPSLLPC